MTENTVSAEDDDIELVGFFNGLLVVLGGDIFPEFIVLKFLLVNEFFFLLYLKCSVFDEIDFEYAVSLVVDKLALAVGFFYHSLLDILESVEIDYILKEWEGLEKLDILLDFFN